MSAIPAISLRYFDCRGRAQTFRLYFHARSISFIDARVSMKDSYAAWPPIKGNEALSGPFSKLPVLHWGKELVAESPVIHDWLHRKLGDEARLGEQDNLQHAMLNSSCRSELGTSLGLLLYQDLMYPGIDLKTTVPGTLKRLHDHLALLEATLTRWHWFDKLAQRQTMLADCQLWEMLDWMDCIFDAHVDWAALPSLRRFHQHHEQAPLFRHLLSGQPQLTGRPQEADAIKRIRAAL